MTDFQLPERDPIAREADRRMLHGALARLSNAGSPLLRDIADDLRSGRASHMDIARRPELAEPFKAAAERFKKWNEGLTDKEREAIVSEMEKRVQRMRQQVADEWAAEGKLKGSGQQT